MSQQFPSRVEEKQEIPPPFPAVTSVEVDGLVLLQIIKHASEQFPASRQVSGQLLGLQNGSVLQFTNSFPAIKESNSAKPTYNEQMIDIMRRLRNENFIVGWYRSVNRGLFIEPKTLHHQIEYQKENPSSVCLIYDPSNTRNGKLSLRAIRLREKFIKFYESKQYGPTQIGELGLTSKDIIEELPVKIHNSHMVHAFLFDMRSQNLTSHCAFSRLHQSHERDLVSNLRQLSNLIDEFQIQTDNFRTYHSKCMKNKKAREIEIKKWQDEAEKVRSLNRKPKPMPNLEKLYPREAEPPRLHAMVLIGQMGEYTNTGETGVTQGISKLWVTQGIHQDKLLTQ